MTESRKRSDVIARAVQAVLLREKGLTYPAIANALGYKDHTTAIYHVKQHAHLMEYDRAYRAVYEEMQEKFE